MGGAAINRELFMENVQGIFIIVDEWTIAHQLLSSNGPAIARIASPACTVSAVLVACRGTRDPPSARRTEACFETAREHGGGKLAALFFGCRFPYIMASAAY